ncbi:glutaredoxin [Tulasnella sp. 417]|nr:glutaredoxin [Tulasnella sp. 417]
MASFLLLRSLSAHSSARSIPPRLATTSSTSYRRSRPLYPTANLALFGLFSSSSQPTPSMAVKELVEDAIANHKVAIFSKTYCPYCRRAKELIESFNLPEGEVEIVEIDIRDDGSAIQEYLKEKTGQRTVPNIFINKEHIGGSDDLADLNSAGQLKPKLIA